MARRSQAKGTNEEKAQEEGQEAAQAGRDAGRVLRAASTATGADPGGITVIPDGPTGLVSENGRNRLSRLGADLRYPGEPDSWYSAAKSPTRVFALARCCAELQNGSSLGAPGNRARLKNARRTIWRAESGPVIMGLLLTTMIAGPVLAHTVTASPTSPTANCRAIYAQRLPLR